jgi:hypothetical protein
VQMCMPASQVGRRSKVTICFRRCSKFIYANSGTLIYDTLIVIRILF